MALTSAAAAAMAGRQELLEWLRLQVPLVFEPRMQMNVVSIVRKNGSMQALKALPQGGATGPFPVGEMAGIAACRHGHFHILRWCIFEAGLSPESVGHWAILERIAFPQIFCFMQRHDLLDSIRTSDLESIAFHGDLEALKVLGPIVTAVAGQ